MLKPDEMREWAKDRGEDTLTFKWVNELADLAESHAALRKEVEALRDAPHPTANELRRLGGAEGSMDDEFSNIPEYDQGD